MIVSYFSGGVSSAVATKMVVDDLDRIVYTHIDDHHPDTMRFVRDCEEWFGKQVELMQSPLKSVDNTCRFQSFIHHPGRGACCTKHLKREVRKAFERKHQGAMQIVWGLDCTEEERCERIRQSMPDHKHLFPLVDERINKSEAHRILKASGIKRPAMYVMGYHNNNCIGCVKGGMGYWNKIRVDFPNVFESRAVLERDIGFPILGKGIWLDELDPDRGRHAGPICGDCGIMCEMMAI